MTKMWALCDAVIASLIQETHRLYLQKLEEMSQLQDKCSSSISIQRKRLMEVHQLLKK